MARRRRGSCRADRFWAPRQASDRAASLRRRRGCHRRQGSAGTSHVHAGHAGDKILPGLRGVKVQAGQKAVKCFGRAGDERMPEGARRPDFALGMAGAAEPVGCKVRLRMGVLGEQPFEEVGGVLVTAAFERADSGDGKPVGGARAAGEDVRQPEQIGRSFVKRIDRDAGILYGTGGDG